MTKLEEFKAILKQNKEELNQALENAGGFKAFLGDEPYDEKNEYNKAVEKAEQRLLEFSKMFPYYVVTDMFSSNQNIVEVFMTLDEAAMFATFYSKKMWESKKYPDVSVCEVRNDEIVLAPLYTDAWADREKEIVIE